MKRRLGPRSALVRARQHHMVPAGPGHGGPCGFRGRRLGARDRRVSVRAAPGVAHLGVRRLSGVPVALGVSVVVARSRPAGGGRPGTPPDALAPVALAASALAVAAQVVPAGSWLPGVRRMLLPSLAGRGDPGHVALTFDDGPDPRATPYVLDALDELSVRATFFVLGERVRRHPELTREIAARGHELEVHGWTHSSPWLPSVTRDVRDLTRAAEVVRQAAGTVPCWYRPPFGILTGSRWFAARRAGLRPVLWTAWGRDWTADATAQSVLATVRRDLRGGGTVLLHDRDRAAAPGCWRAALAALPRLVVDCRASGLAVGPLAEHRCGR